MKRTNTNFTLEDLDAPVVGDRYVHRDKEAKVVEITSTHVVLAVNDRNGSFRKSVTFEEFRVLERRSLDAGAIFIPVNL